ncbi:MAG TPA: DUF1987 domain-containing protein [Rhodocyclaceae bacterium]|jgi:hypothetical protein|nr:DUF1987 domain-containing protein [Rhodocyclaceae bacterium]
MQDLIIPATAETPAIHFSAGSRTLRIQGESYPENAMTFYAPIRNWLQSYLLQDGDDLIEVHFSLKYFNSSSTKLLRSLIALLDDAARAGKHIATYWYHDPEDDMMLEFGQDLHDEFGALHVQVTPMEMA